MTICESALQSEGRQCGLRSLAIAPFHEHKQQPEEELDVVMPHSKGTPSA